MPSVDDLLAQDRHRPARRLDFTCAGSCDYLTGRPFSFVPNLDAVGRVAADLRDSHVEMDGAWALYEAWVRLQHGDIDIARRDRLGPVVDRRARARSTRWRSTRTTSRRSAPTRCRSPALQARALIDAGKVDRARLGRGRRRAAGATRRTTRTRRCAGDFDVDELLAEPLRARRRCAGTTCRRSPTARSRSCSPAATRPASCASGRRGSRGFDHRTELHQPGMRDLTTSPSTDAGRAQGRRRRRPGRGRRAVGGVHPRGAAPARGARPRRRRRRSTRRAAPLAGEPDHGHRPRPHRRGRRSASSTAADRGARALDRRARACNRTSSASWKVSR